jgi:ATP-dependent RNA circularization protein (DNA/RNA ligase family)
MFLKYEKTFRIRIPQIKVPGKLHLSKIEVKRLLTGKVDIEEKLDGANVGFYRHKNGFSLQKRGSLVGQSEHLQFKYFNNWAMYRMYNNIMRVPIGFRVYAELCYVRHNIFYNKLPDYVIVIDVMEGDRWLNREEKQNFCDEFDFSIVPLVAQGYFGIEDLWDIVPVRSAFGRESEGVVVKKFHKKKGYMRGKIVKPEFIKKINDDGHWMHKKIVVNELRT